jgi:microcystin-dependent protein
MARVRAKARIGERTITAGNGPYTLAGAWDASYNTFASMMAVGDTTTLSVVEPGVAFWTGIATYSATNEITLTTVEETKGTFGSGTKEIFAGQMASSSMFRDDISRGIVTGGTGAAYTLSTFQGFTSLANMDRSMVTFVPLLTNTGAVTLNVDGLGAKPLRSGNLVELPAGTLIGGAPYTATYFSSNNEWYVHGFFGNPFNMPLGGIMQYPGPAAPNAFFAIPLGQAILRTTYAALFALIGTTYGSGDGSTTFNLPDLGGRVIAGKEATATRLTTAGGGVDGGTLGAFGGAQNGVIAQVNLPAVTLATTITDPGHIHGTTNINGASGINSAGGSTGFGGVGRSEVPMGGGGSGFTINSASTGITASTALGGSGTAFKLPQPTIILNNIMRVL